ncbi:MAG TPA: hypothetical protein VIU93_13205 [Gallionellaceae bacterium]
MKKLALALAGLVLGSLFAPAASALPAFARQTGFACNQCHFQHFPLLNAFGRSFKGSAFTLMGTQPKVEGENMSIPTVMNASFLASLGYEKTNAVQDPTTSALVSTGGAPTGGAYVAGTGGESSLFVGGRGSDFMGYLGEITLAPTAAIDSLKTPMLYAVGDDTRAGIVPFTTNGQGSSYGFETLNTGANAVHTITNTVGFMDQYIAAVSAQQYLGTGAAATGAAFVVSNGIGFINITKFNQGGIAGGNFGSLSSTYARAVFTFDMAGWDSAVGVQNWSGESATSCGLTLGSNGVGSCSPSAFVSPTPAGNTNSVETATTRATAIDAQMQGSVGERAVGVYVSYAVAPAIAADGSMLGNAFNSGPLERSSLNIAAEIGVVPEIVTVGMAIRRANSGQDEGLLNGGTANGTNATDNAVYFTLTYKMTQNMMARLSYVTQSGTYWTQANSDEFGSSSSTINLYALF